MTDDQWDLLEPVFNTPDRRGRKHADDLRAVVDAVQRSNPPLDTEGSRIRLPQRTLSAT